MTWLERWKRDWLANATEADANAYMDSGWSQATAERTAGRAVTLLRELVARLALTVVTPEDMFDRPELVELIEAAKVTGFKEK